MPHETAERGEQCCQSVDREHPDRGNAGQFEISSAEGLERGEDDFQKPAEQSAVDIVVEEFAHEFDDSFRVG